MNVLFIVAMIVTGLFGLGFLFVPGALMAPLGVTLDATAGAFARLFGSLLVAQPFLLWFARRSNQPGFRLGVAYSLFTYFLISSILLISIQLQGLMNGLGWIIVGLHIVMAIWFGYFVVKKEIG
jgi:hypothetical protein